MGTYFHGNTAEIQANNNGDGLQTLILMNPAYVGYSENQPPPPQQNNNNFVFRNLPPALPPQQPQQHFVGIPLHNTSSTTTQDQDVSALHGFIPRIHYNLYNTQMEIAAAREFTRAQQGLSLSLSSQQSPGYGSYREVVASQPMDNIMSPLRVDDVRGSGGSPSSASGVSNGGVQSVLLSSKYLKVAQQLLDEVVNVGKGKNGGESPMGGASRQGKVMGESSGGGAACGDGGEGSEKRVTELTTAERQEIQMKKAKLVNMLDEVEQRYRQYHDQMQIVISWFEQSAGIGSAKTYTALALQTISKQFRCLKDAILGQIRSAGKSLGEEDNLVGKIEGSRLKYVDNQIRQQRALQQLGLIQHNAWRPQRGLPERSVSVLRAWLFEHFLHPYPKDSDKIMLAKQTGLTRSQVSNWFINARVRLWKPMVEEMYTEEIRENEKNGSDDKTNNTKNQKEDSSSKSTSPQAKKPVSENPINPINQNMSTNSTSPNIRNITGFNLIRSTSEIENITQQSPKKPRNTEFLHPSNIIPSMNMDLKPSNSENDHIMKFGDQRDERDGFTLMGAPTNFIGGFGSYPIAELGRFGSDQFQTPYSGNGVSLTLGLPHCENLSMTGSHQNFLSNQLGEANDFNGMNAQTSNNVYENMNIQNRKRFAAQLLPDFVT